MVSYFFMLLKTGHRTVPKRLKASLNRLFKSSFNDHIIRSLPLSALSVAIGYCPSFEWLRWGNDNLPQQSPFQISNFHFEDSHIFVDVLQHYLGILIMYGILFYWIHAIKCRASNWTETIKKPKFDSLQRFPLMTISSPIH